MQFFHPPVTSSHFGRNILLSTSFSNTVCLSVFCHYCERLSFTPYKTMGKFIVW
jgi:hypothetical protein